MHQVVTDQGLLVGINNESFEQMLSILQRQLNTNFPMIGVKELTWFPTSFTVVRDHRLHVRVLYPGENKVPVPNVELFLNFRFAEEGPPPEWSN